MPISIAFVSRHVTLHLRITCTFPSPHRHKFVPSSQSDLGPPSIFQHTRREFSSQSDHYPILESPHILPSYRPYPSTHTRATKPTPTFIPAIVSHGKQPRHPFRVIPIPIPIWSLLPHTPRPLPRLSPSFQSSILSSVISSRPRPRPSSLS